VNDAREMWFAAQPDLDPERLVFLNETVANNRMTRRYGRAPYGERCRVAVPRGHYKTTTVTAALPTTGLIATALVDGATNGERSRGYVIYTLDPVLPLGETVILDNLPAHKMAGVRDTIEGVGELLLPLPHYSPDFNPSKRCSPSSRRSFVVRQPAPFRIRGARSEKPRTASRHPSAETI